MKLVCLYILATPAVRADRDRDRDGLARCNVRSMLNSGPHGLSEVLYAFTSAAQQQRLRVRRASAVNTAWYNTALGLAMLLGRFLPIVFVLALAGSLARQQPVPGHRRHAARRTGRCSSACSLGVIAHRRRASPTSPPWRSGRSRKVCTDVDHR